MTKTIAILGATSGMGEALARALASRHDAIAILGRDAQKLQESALDLSIRGASKVSHHHCDLEDTDTFEDALRGAEAALGGLDVVIVSAGLFATQDALEADPGLAEKLTRINFTNTLVFCEHARKTLLARGGGTLCVFSSVAGERGRKPVVIYGASKAGLSRYLEGLDHRYRGRGLKVVTVKPGFVHTAMTAGLDAPPFAGQPEQVAKIVLSAIDHGDPVVYAPRPWALIMGVIRKLPRSVMRRVGF